MKSELRKLTDLVFDERLYPRRHVDPFHVSRLQRATEGGSTLPPIVICRETNKIIDGVHRYHVALRRGDDTIAVELRRYMDDAARFKDAIKLNTAHGLRLSETDSLKVIAMAESMGLKELDVLEALQTSQAHFDRLKPRYAVTGGKLQKIPLKPSVRHLAGVTLEPAQEEIVRSAPGVSYLLLVTKLIDAIVADTLPSPEQHPVLWEKLGELCEALRGITGELQRKAG